MHVYACLCAVRGLVHKFSRVNLYWFFFLSYNAKDEPFQPSSGGLLSRMGLNKRRENSWPHLKACDVVKDREVVRLASFAQYIHNRTQAYHPQAYKSIRMRSIRMCL